MSNPIPTVASSSSAAAAGGSVIDVNGLVSQLVTATRTPQDAIISSKTQAVTTQVSAIGALKGALSTFQSSLTSLATPSAFNAVLASSSGSSHFNATADTGAVAGTYPITVDHIASAQQLVSKPFTGGSSGNVGDGTLQISLGSTSFNLTVDSTNDTLSGVAAAINAAPGNPGVTAAVITGSDGAHLVLSSTLTGAANTIQVTETDGGTALAALTYGTGNTATFDEKSPAQDAQFTISGIEHTSASNTVTGALSGVTINLLGATTDDTETLNIASDTSTIKANISAFVQGYNALIQQFSSLGSYDATTKTAGPMLGDALLQGVQNDIRSTLYSIVNTGSPQYNSLASIGITTNKDGSLSLNTTTLSNAMSSNPSAVSTLFSGTGGVAAGLNTQVTAALAANGSISSRSATLVKQENDLTQQTNDLNDRMTALTASLTQQYSALNTLLSSLQTTSAYLTQAFASLPTVQQKQ